MTPRGAAIILGVIAACAVAGLANFAWNDTVASIIAGAPDTIAALSLPVNRLAWTITAGVSAFAVVALITALIGGILEMTRSRRRIAELPPVAGEADVRIAFAGTAIAIPAASILAARPLDAARFFSLETIWLERLTLAREVGPLPCLVMAADGALALFADSAGASWSLSAAAGIGGWLLISASRYLTGLALSPFLAQTIAAVATHAAEPSARPAPTAIFQPAINEGVVRTAPFQAGPTAGELADLLAEPLERLADAADRLGSAAPPASREQSVDDALAEIRAGIERLLAATPR